LGASAPLAVSTFLFLRGRCLLLANCAVGPTAGRGALFIGPGGCLPRGKGPSPRSLTSVTEITIPPCVLAQALQHSWAYSPCHQYNWDLALARSTLCVSEHRRTNHRGLKKKHDAKSTPSPPHPRWARFSPGDLNVETGRMLCIQDVAIVGPTSPSRISLSIILPRSCHEVTANHTNLTSQDACHHNHEQPLTNTRPPHEHHTIARARPTHRLPRHTTSMKLRITSLTSLVTPETLGRAYPPRHHDATDTLRQTPMVAPP
jgi:hypothetical protein